MVSLRSIKVYVSSNYLEEYSIATTTTIDVALGMTAISGMDTAIFY